MTKVTRIESPPAAAPGRGPAVWGRRLAESAASWLRPQWIRALLVDAIGDVETFAPLARLDLPPGRRLWIVAPHPDDESIGCGGLAALWRRAGRETHVAFLSDGDAGSRRVRQGDPTPGLREAVACARRAEARAALAELGAQGHWLGGRDGRLHRREAALAEGLADLWRRDPPDVVAAPFPADRHADHAAAARITGRAARALGLGPLPALGFEVWSPCAANGVLDITEVAEIKRRAIAAHASQVATTDYVAGAGALNRFRAVSAGLGPERVAEAFHVGTLARYADLADRLRLSGRGAS
ncbi:MAG: PIG-L deacetylase family protein [Pseudomonadota bacterium]